MPTSPIQEYFERKIKAASENSSPAIPVSPQIERRIEEQLTKALNELAKKQAASAQKASATTGSDGGMPLNALPQRRGSLAASTGYTAPSVSGSLKRRSLGGSNMAPELSSIKGLHGEASYHSKFFYARWFNIPITRPRHCDTSNEQCPFATKIATLSLFSLETLHRANLQLIYKPGR